MYKIFFLILILNFFPLYAKSDVWTCKFKDTVNKVDVNETFRKENDKYFLYVNKQKLPILKTFENNEYIHLIFSKDIFLVATIVNKKTKEAKKVFMSMGKNYGQSLSLGKCHK